MYDRQVISTNYYDQISDSMNVTLNSARWNNLLRIANSKFAHYTSNLECLPYLHSPPYTSHFFRSICSQNLSLGPCQPTWSWRSFSNAKTRTSFPACLIGFGCPGTTLHTPQCHSTLHTPHFTLRTLHFTLHTFFLFSRSVRSLSLGPC